MDSYYDSDSDMDCYEQVTDPLTVAMDLCDNPHNLCIYLRNTHGQKLTRTFDIKLRNNVLYLLKASLNREPEYMLGYLFQE